MSSTVMITGFVTGMALIAAVGAQNAFVLRQGIRREHITPIVIACLASDIIAITAGALGFGALITRWPQVLPIATVLGALYLFAFGIQAAYRAWKPSALEGEGGRRMSAKRAVLTLLALTWLNPHFYLDTIVLLGSMANQFGQDRSSFIVGTLGASFVWFISLGYGARALRRFFEHPTSWRVLDGSIAVLMGVLGTSLLVH